MITMTQRGRKAATNSGTPLLASLLAPVLALTLAGTAFAGEAQHPDPASYGLDPETGVFKHPAEAPYWAYSGPRPFDGSLEELEDATYIKNMTVEGHWPIVVKPGHSWQHTVDMDGHRYMIHYYRHILKIYDITNPKEMEIVLEKTYEDGNWFGAAAIAYNEKLEKWIMIQSFEVPRSIGGLKGKKYDAPEAVKAIKEAEAFRGVRIYEMDSITEWRQIAEISTNTLNPHGTRQEGSGALDVPNYDGGKYAFVAAAPDNTFTNIEYPNYIYSPAQMILDVEDPYNPKWVSTWWVPGQRLGEEEYYKEWRQYGNRVSWTGARLPISTPVPLDEGGRYGYTVMGGLGFHVLDLQDPANPKAVGSVDLPVNVGGVEGDNIDVTRVQSRGIVLANGYPMNEDCYEPYKDIFVIDVKTPEAPEIISVLPRPTPPAEAPYTDFCQRRGKFGPKRPSPFFAPGQADDNLAIYPFNNAGVQVFDISDPKNAEIVAYFTPPMTDDLDDPRSYITPVESIFVEWDRNLIWAMANSGMYLLTSDALGTPQFDLAGIAGN
ncbi:hypothetical protein [Roseovarius sp.]|uniref:hypothetical protein n=1 Tax=Roseovarius sp. TaxID=1486281 RepID=UPI000C459CB0|nr:hypothetical protein [Roseovarius sp.]MAO26619.1 hypothetical protein [Roseovarius sp.]MAZ21192.1 hypothetical protein [Roseovarius sp.]